MNKNKLKVTLEFDLAENPEAFEQFVKALINGGFEAEMKEMGQLMEQKLEALKETA